MRVPLALHAVVLCLVVVPVLLGQDAVKVDPTHYTVISENAEVRILKVHYGAHEKSVMHSHPDSVAVALNDSTVQFTLPGGKTENATFKTGQAVFTPAGTHLPENTGDKGMDIVLVELKGKSAMAKSEMK
jgi:hypothetical protein